MSEQKTERPLIPKQPECNIGTSGHVDHGKCVRWDQYVLLNGIPLNGDEIMNMANHAGALVTHVDGGEVYELDEADVVAVNEKYEPVKARSLFYVEHYTGPMYSVKGRTGRTISVTPEHPLLVNRLGKILWVKAKELGRGDHMAFLSQVPLQESTTFPDPLPRLKEIYQIVTWKDYEQLKVTTDGFENFVGLGIDDLEKLRVLGGLSITKFCGAARIDPKTYLKLLHREKTLTLQNRQKLTAAIKRTTAPTLRLGEFLIVQKTGRSRHIRKLKEVELDSDLVKWFAFVWSEGSSGSGFIEVTQEVQRQMLEEYLEITTKKLGLNFRAYHGGQYRVFNKPFLDYLRLKFDFSPGNKYESPIAGWVCRLPRSMKATFLRWFLTLDGEFDAHSGSLAITQANEKNISVISYMLHSFGIVPRFGKVRRKVKSGTREYFRLSVSGRRNLGLFAENIGFENREIQTRLVAYLRRIKRASKETDLAIPLELSSMRTFFSAIGLLREAFRRTPDIPTMKESSWYKAYEGALRTGRISRTKLLLLVQSIEEQMSRIDHSFSEVLSSTRRLREHLELLGISLESAAGDLGISRKKLSRILKRGSKPEIGRIRKIVGMKTQEILRVAQPTIEQLRVLSRSPLEFDRIAAVEVEPYDGPIFDLTVPGYGNFIAGKGAIVAHNTSIVQSITGVWASAHSEELRRGITIKVGYADAAFYKCQEQDPPACYSTSPNCPIEGKPTKLLRAVSFVDAPGHESLMTNMLAGAFLMDGALLVIAANEPVPRPQTREHLQALQMLGMKKIVVVQNKIDLVTEEEARKNYQAIEKFVENTIAKSSPIIPVSAQQRINIDALIEAIEEVIPTPKRDPAADALMYVVRSFDVNRPGSDISELHGGVLGGSLLRGEMKVGDEIEMRPGMPDERSGKYVPVSTKVYTLGTGAGITDRVGPGGLVAVGTELDPAFTKNDQMVGSVIGKPSSLPPVWEHVTLDHELFESVVGSAEPVKVEKIRVGEGIRLNLGTASTLANATSVRDRALELELKKPVCIEEGARAAISRRIAERWRLIGSGVLK